MSLFGVLMDGLTKDLRLFQFTASKMLQLWFTAKNLDSFTAELLFTMCLSLTCRGVDTLPYTQSLSIAHD